MDIFDYLFASELSEKPPNWWPAVRRGLLAAIVFGFLWDLFYSMTRVRLDWVPALSIGLLVGLAMRGGSLRRTKWWFGVTGACLALVGSLACDLWSLWGIVVTQLGFLPHHFLHPMALWVILVDQFGVQEWLAYALTAAESYALATRGKKEMSAFWLRAVKRFIGPALAVILLGLLFGLLFFNMHRIKIADLQLSPDGKTLAASSSGYSTSVDHMVLLWDTATEERRVFMQERSGIIAWSPNSQLLAIVVSSTDAAGHDRGRVALWHVGDGKPLGFTKKQGFFIESLAFSQKGDIFATGSQVGTVKLWDVETLVEKATIELGCCVSSLTFAKNDQWLAVGMRNGTIAIWDVTAGRQQDVVQAHRAAVSSLVFAEDRQVLFSAGSVDATVKTWSLGPFVEEGSFRLPMGWIQSLTLSPDGQTLAVAGGSVRRPGEVKLLDAQTGAEKQRFVVHANTVCRAVFTRDGKTLIAGTAAPISPFTLQRHGEIYRWDILTGQQLDPLP